MGSKTQKQSKRFSCGELRERAERSLKKLDFKQAHKDAKLCYQLDPAPAHRDLLERAWFHRAVALHRSGLVAESRELAQGLLDFGVTQPEVLERLPELLTAVGLLDRALGGKGPVAVEVRPELLARAADQAVLAPATAPKSLPEIAPGAARVRAALEALYAGDETTALDQMKAVPRSSPFADWRLFVRGLAAYYRGDAADAQAHWDRLEPRRVPAQIATSLRTVSGQGGAADAGASRLAELEKAILGGSLTASVQQIQASLAEEDPIGAIKVLRRCRPALLAVAPEIVSRIERLLVATLVPKQQPQALANLCQMVAPPAIDPRWNRTWALFWEHCGRDEPARQHWHNYLEDLAALPEFTPQERSMAQAMVWSRIGEMHLSQAHEAWTPWRKGEASLNQHREQAIHCFREAIRLFPGFRVAHQALAATYSEWGRDTEAAEAHRGLLEQFPDDLDSLKFLYQYHSRRQEPLVARDYALSGWRLKPANREWTAMARKAHLAAARHFALEGQWELGRAEFAAAERLASDASESYSLLVSKAIFEFKAGDEGAGKRFRADAIAALDNALPAFLLLLIEAIRYKLPYRLDGVLSEAEVQFQRGLSGKTQGRAAARLCRILKDLLTDEIEYPSRDIHLKQVLAYLKRCGRVRWEVGDLREVCGFLQAMPQAFRKSEWRGVYEKLLRRGMKLFPECPEFPIWAGGHEIELGPRGGGPFVARRYLEEGRKLAKEAGPAAAELLQTAERQLAFVDKCCSMLPDFGSILNDDEEDLGEENEEDAPFESLPPPDQILSDLLDLCQKLGLDPMELLENLATETPLRFSTPARKKRPSRRKGKTKS